MGQHLLTKWLTFSANNCVLIFVQNSKCLRELLPLLPFPDTNIYGAICFVGFDLGGCRTAKNSCCFYYYN